MKYFILYIEKVCCVPGRVGPDQSIQRHVLVNQLDFKITITKKSLWSVKWKKTITFLKRKKKTDWPLASPQVHLLLGDREAIPTKCASGFCVWTSRLSCIKATEKQFFNARTQRYCSYEFLRNLLRRNFNQSGDAWENRKITDFMYWKYSIVILNLKQMSE